MGKETGIAWTNHTFNPWWGCTKVSPGCDHCYAESFAKRTGRDVWGKDAERGFFDGEAHWRAPVTWNKAAEKKGARARVFCASMADVFEGREDEAERRRRLWRLIMATPMLDWQLLTKRPGAVMPLLKADLEVSGRENGDAALAHWLWSWTKGKAPANVWVGTTVEDQTRADVRVDQLREIPAVVRFLSMEPLLEAIQLDVIRGVDWIIVGGESGGGSRPFQIEWARSLLKQARGLDARFFMKQLGAKAFEANTHAALVGQSPLLRVINSDAKGGDLSTWPLDLRVQELPTPRTP